jgi:PIN domain nuclease of toxin-antitoxin system
VRFLADTHLLLWAAAAPEKLSAEAIGFMSAGAHEVYFSAASIWEVAIKTARGRPDFQVDAEKLRVELTREGFLELPVSAAHGAAIAGLPPLHQDPFDRLLLAQAILEGMVFLTADRQLGRYPGPVRVV